MKLSNKNKKIAVIGAGSWGTAIAIHLAKSGHHVSLWGRNALHVEQIGQDRCNKKYLPQGRFPDNLHAVKGLEKALVACDIVCMVVPSHCFRLVFCEVCTFLSQDCTIVVATKGIENDSLQTMSQIVDHFSLSGITPYSVEYGVLSGPSFAKEVVEEVPTAVTIGCRKESTCLELQRIFSSKYLRVYTSSDIIGIEISASLKNIVAIAAGICDGLKFGSNARAALITRGLAEICRFGLHFGADRNTFSGLSGLGDLVLTCTGNLSRNRSVGLKLGQGKTLQNILAEMSMVAEGVKTTKSVYELAKREKIDMPILEQTYKVLYENKDCRKAVEDLLQRDPKAEDGGF